MINKPFSKMDKKLLFNLAYWIMIVAVIGTCIFLIFYLKSSGKECVANPLEFYARKTATECFCVGDLFAP